MTGCVIYSGNQPGWLTATANMLQDRGADEAPLTRSALLHRVPDQVGTARNDGHVTAAENGLDRDDYKAGYEIWVDGVLHALRLAQLIEGDDEGLRWVGDPTKTHKVKFHGKSYSVPDKEPRRESRDRYMLGDPTKDWMSSSLAAEGRVLRGDTPPLKVKVRTHSKGREYVREQQLEIHPLALAIPPMTPDEQKFVREDIAKHGVKVPLILYPDKDDVTTKGNPKKKVLDGRHRAYFASVTGQPVQTEEFTGSEQDARDHVASLNLHRRQLTVQQRALAIVRLYGEQARAETKANQVRKPINSVGSKSTQQNGKSEGQKWYERAHELAGGKASGVSVGAVKAMGEVAKAPETAAAVERGEIRKTSKALHDAREEITGEAQDRSGGNAVSSPKSPMFRLGTALYELRAVKREWDDDAALEHREEIHTRAGELILLAEWIRDRVIPGVPR